MRFIKDSIQLSSWDLFLYKLGNCLKSALLFCQLLLPSHISTSRGWLSSWYWPLERNLCHLRCQYIAIHFYQLHSFASYLILMMKISHSVTLLICLSSLTILTLKWIVSHFNQSFIHSRLYPNLHPRSPPCF